MPYQTTVDVTQEDIDTAMRKNSSRCVVATAIARKFPKAQRIVVDVHSIKFTDGDRRYTYLTPPKVMDYIVAFDAGDELHPFAFRLRDDQKLVQRRDRKTAKGKSADSAGAKVRATARKLEAVTEDPAATPAQREVAADNYAAAVAAAEQAKQVPGPTRNREDVTDVPAEQVKQPPVGRSTVFYRNQRAYGQRTMRVNKVDDAPAEFRGPLDVTE